MNLFCGEGHLERAEEAEDAYRVGTTKDLRLQLYLETSRHPFNSAYHVVIAVLVPVGQAINEVAQGCPIVAKDRFDDGYDLFRRMVTSVKVVVDPLVAPPAPAL